MSNSMSPAAARYGDWLRERMDERGLTQRQLGKLLNPENPEVARRSVRRYLNGMTPILRTREAISAALGTEDLGPTNSDDEEDDLLIQALRKLDEVYAMLQKIGDERGLLAKPVGPGRRLIDDLDLAVTRAKTISVAA